jgi:acetyltransferase-like isoleucine patch superfamily enzyme
MQVINKLIQKLGKDGYTLDPSLSKLDIFIVVSGKFFAVLRGLYLKIWLKKSAGLVFLGRKCSIKHCHKIRLGKTVTIGDNVEINALSKNGIQIGNNVSIHRNTIIECTGVIRELGEGLQIGNNVGIAQNCFIQVRGNVSIGSNVMFGPGVSIFSENHGFEKTDVPMIEQPTVRKGVVIEDDVWLGTRCVILDGVTIGKGSIVAAGAIVNASVPPYSIVAGVPAKVIKSRLVQPDINH